VPCLQDKGVNIKQKEQLMFSTQIHEQIGNNGMNINLIFQYNHNTLWVNYGLI